MKKPRPRSVGIHKVDAIFLVLLGLKLSGQIDWTWWWVLSPYWIAPTFNLAVSLWNFFRSPESLSKKVREPDPVKRSWALRTSDGLFLLFFVLKWTGHLSWSWLWVLSPLWIGKPLGFLTIHAVAAKKRRRWKKTVLDLIGSTVILVTAILIPLRLDGHISSWWWVAGGSAFSLVIALVAGMGYWLLFDTLEEDRKLMQKIRDARAGSTRRTTASTG